MAADNKLLGQFDLVGIPSAPRGIPQIEVTFDIDANGIVNVSAKDKATGKEQQIRIEASGGLSDSDIDRMVQEAEAHASEDKQRKELVEARNHAESLIHTTERNLTDYGDKVPETVRTALGEDLAQLRGVLESENAEEIKAKMETLAQSAMRLGEAMYKAEQAATSEASAAPTSEPGSEDASEDEVVDVDFEEVKDEKDDQRDQDRSA